MIYYTPASNGSTPPGTVPDILPPHDVDAERALLGSILIDDYRLTEIASLQLTNRDFYIHKHGWIFDAMLDLHQNGQAIGPITLGDRLERGGRLDEIGGPAELTSLINDTPTSVHAVYYAGIVKDYAKRRKAIELAGALSRLAFGKADGFERQLLEKMQELQALVAEGNAQDWEIFTLADAYRPRPPLAWVVNGLFSLPSLNIVYGPPGCMKSLLLADLVTCVSAGLPWLESLPGQSAKPFQTISAPVLWVDFDNGRRRTHERFEALARARDLPTDTPLRYTSMPAPWLDASDPLAVDRLINRINRFGAKLAVLDNLGTISGGVDENSPAIIPVMSNLRQLAERTGAAIVVIHHQRKGNGLKGRAGDTLRGHSSIEAALDLALLVERKEDNDRVSVKSTKTRDIDVLPFSAEWTREHKPGTSELATAKFFGVEPDEDEATAALQAAILACVKVNPGLSQQRLWQSVKASQPAIGRDAILTENKRMVQAGRLREIGAENGRSYAYYVNDEYVPF